MTSFRSDRRAPNQIAQDINQLMSWDTTPQGGEFWSKVYEELQRLDTEYNQWLMGAGAATTARAVGNSVPVSQGSSHRCIDCSLMRCSAPDTRCPECDANIKGGP